MVRAPVLAHHTSLIGSVVCGVALALASCGDPVTDRAIAALGPEDPAVPRGPLHRPGQPCLLCHQNDGAAPAFALAGTVFTQVTSQTPVGGASIIVVDSTDTRFATTTNCAGNFFVKPEAFAPRYPIWLTVRSGQVQREMSSPVYREGSCGACHTRPRGPASPGPVYLIEDPTTETLPTSPCP